MIGSPRIHLETVDSTNRYLRDLLAESPEEGTLVTADAQTAGRGRHERRWLSAPAENVLASILLYPPRESDEWGGLPLLAGLAVTRTVRATAAIDVSVKWPNDVLAGGRKLCGILVESGHAGSRSWAVVGIGINVNQRSFDGSYRLPPTSMSLESGRTFDLTSVIETLCAELDVLYAAWKDGGNGVILPLWKGASDMMGKDVTVEDAGGTRTGIAEDIAPDGALLLRRSDGSTETVYAGDVTVREVQS